MSDEPTIYGLLCAELGPGRHDFIRAEDYAFLTEENERLREGRSTDTVYAREDEHHEVIQRLKVELASERARVERYINTLLETEKRTIEAEQRAARWEAVAEDLGDKLDREAGVLDSENETSDET